MATGFPTAARSRVLVMGIGMVSILGISLFGCSINTDAKKAATLDQPAEIVDRFAKAQASDLATAPQAEALRRQVAAYLAGRYSITDAAYYKESASVPWAGVSQYVATARAAGARIAPGGGKPAFEPWHKPEQLTDVYPADDRYGAFAVAMARDPLPDGTRLIGYFALEPAKP